VTIYILKKDSAPWSYLDEIAYFQNPRTNTGIATCEQTEKTT